MKIIVTFFVFLLAALFFFVALTLLHEAFLMVKRLFKGEKQRDISLFSWFSPFQND
ncbi:MAG: hypothetical protein WC271_15685 [Bacteroidales bacterium]|jgi:D-alanyl-lipoteichoic acid acyltransferase DltB (MBOAT superfamily)|nr:hypothetical protein [Bacteroidales bacterium]MDD4178192.1 hypothetical protein [Bacteroidales bacterium]MDD4740438.1 hypothetical protein [Bacteroidales bacterium]